MPWRGGVGTHVCHTAGRLHACMCNKVGQERLSITSASACSEEKPRLAASRQNNIWTLRVFQRLCLTHEDERTVKDIP